MFLRTFRLVLLAGSLPLFFAGTNAQAAPPAESIADLRNAFVHTLEQQNIEASIALFAPDALFLTPDGGRYDDRAAIRTLYRSVVAQYHARITMTSKRVNTSDQFSVDEGIYNETLTPNAAGKPMVLTGSYVLLAKRQPDGSWKIAELVWTGGVGGPR